MTQIALDTSAPAGGTPEERAAKFRLSMYLVPILGAPLLLLVGICLLMPTHWFAVRTHDPYTLGLAYGDTLRNADCQILIYGDSSAEVGLNPQTIEQRTGLSTCNIAEPATLNEINGPVILDNYLQHNKPPRILVLFFSPENLDPGKSKYHGAGLFEAVTYRIRRGGILGTLQLIVTNPKNFFAWAFSGLSLLPHIIVAHPATPEELTMRQHLHGQMLLFNEDYVLGDCAVVDTPIPPSRSWIAGLRAKYSSPATRVIFDTDAIPDCDPGRNVLPSMLHGVIDNPIMVLPRQDFYYGGRHVTPAGSAILSNALATQLSAILGAH